LAYLSPEALRVLPRDGSAWLVPASAKNKAFFQSILLSALFKTPIDLNDGAQAKRNTEYRAHCSMLQFAWALDRAALELRLSRIGARKYPGAHKRGWSRSIRGLGTKTLFMDASQERHPTAATFDADNTKNSIKMTN
jgi:hypothetical protein